MSTTMLRLAGMTAALAFSAALHAAPRPEAAPPGATSSASAGVNADYRQQLLQLAEADQKIRAETLKQYTPQQLQNDPGVARTLAMQIHASQQQNQARLSELIAKFGFPDAAAVGADGAHAGFLVAQHVTDRAFRDTFLQGIEAAAQKGLYSKADLALFVDRNRILAGQPQVYGSQRKADGSLFEVEQPEQLQQRRAAMGLPPEVEKP